LLREAPFGSDFSYSEAKIAQRHNNDLGNDLGNLLQRTLSMVDKYRAGIVPQAESGRSEFGRRFLALPATVRRQIFDLRFRDALESAWELVTALNRAIDDRKPWLLRKEARDDELDALLYDLCEGLRWLAMLLHPFMPERMEEMWRQLGANESVTADWSSALDRWGGLEPGTATQAGAALFPRIELGMSGVSA